jgi:Arc/MetJ family transcription regulator
MSRQLSTKQWTKRKAANRCMLHIDDELMMEAQKHKGHVSVKAVSDKYDRLLRSKLRLKRPRTFLSRLLALIQPD